MRKFLRAIFFSLVTFVSLALVDSAIAATDILRPDHPDRYDVKDGDTLWDIATMFLKDAWRWPEIWQVNPDIDDPHLIYPGDVILLSYVDDQPRLSVSRRKDSRTVKLVPEQPVSQLPVPQLSVSQERVQGDRNVKLLPRIRRTSLKNAIAAIPLDAISSMITTGRIVGQHTLDNAPHILAGISDRLIFGPGDGFYARGVWPEDKPSVFGIYRRGQVFLDPETGEVLGFEAREVGTAKVERRKNDLYTFTLSTVNEDVRLGDRLLPTEQRRVESTFYPAAPSRNVEGVIMMVLGGVTQVGRNDIVVVNRGMQHGLNIGNILAIHKRGAIVSDRTKRERVELPTTKVGLLMVFRSFEKMAYGLVLETKEPLRIGDTVQNP